MPWFPTTLIGIERNNASLLVFLFHDFGRFVFSLFFPICSHMQLIIITQQTKKTVDFQWQWSKLNHIDWIALNCFELSWCLVLLLVLLLVGYQAVHDTLDWNSLIILFGIKMKHENSNRIKFSFLYLKMQPKKQTKWLMRFKNEDWVMVSGISRSSHSCFELTLCWWSITSPISFQNRPSMRR